MPRPQICPCEDVRVLIRSSASRHQLPHEDEDVFGWYWEATTEAGDDPRLRQLHPIQGLMAVSS